jgi:hypothetical protein
MTAGGPADRRAYIRSRGEFTERIGPPQIGRGPRYRGWLCRPTQWSAAGIGVRAGDRRRRRAAVAAGSDADARTAPASAGVAAAPGSALPGPLPRRRRPADPGHLRCSRSRTGRGGSARAGVAVGGQPGRGCRGVWQRAAGPVWTAAPPRPGRAGYRPRPGFRHDRFRHDRFRHEGALGPVGGSGGPRPGGSSLARTGTGQYADPPHRPVEHT